MQKMEKNNISELEGKVKEGVHLQDPMVCEVKDDLQSDYQSQKYKDSSQNEASKFYVTLKTLGLMQLDEEIAQKVPKQGIRRKGKGEESSRLERLRFADHELGQKTNANTILQLKDEISSASKLDSSQANQQEADSIKIQSKFDVRGEIEGKIEQEKEFEQHITLQDSQRNSEAKESPRQESKDLADDEKMKQKIGANTVCQQKEEIALDINQTNQLQAIGTQQECYAFAEDKLFESDGNSTVYGATEFSESILLLSHQESNQITQQGDSKATDLERKTSNENQPLQSNSETNLTGQLKESNLISSLENLLLLLQQEENDTMLQERKTAAENDQYLQDNESDQESEECYSLYLRTQQGDSKALYHKRDKREENESSQPKSEMSLSGQLKGNLVASIENLIHALHQESNRISEIDQYFQENEFDQESEESYSLHLRTQQGDSMASYHKRGKEENESSQSETSLTGQLKEGNLAASIENLIHALNREAPDAAHQECEITSEIDQYLQENESDSELVESYSLYLRTQQGDGDAAYHKRDTREEIESSQPKSETSLTGQLKEGNLAASIENLVGTLEREAPGAVHQECDGISEIDQYSQANESDSELIEYLSLYLRTLLQKQQISLPSPRRNRHRRTNMMQLQTLPPIAEDPEPPPTPFEEEILVRRHRRPLAERLPTLLPTGMRDYMESVRERHFPPERQASFEDLLTRCVKLVSSFIIGGIIVVVLHFLISKYGSNRSPNVTSFLHSAVNSNVSMNALKPALSENGSDANISPTVADISIIGSVTDLYTEVLTALNDIEFNGTNTVSYLNY